MNQDEPKILIQLSSKGNKMPGVGIQPRPPVPLSSAGRAHKFTLGDQVTHTHDLIVVDPLFIMERG